MTQNEIVLDHLKTVGPITQAIAAHEYGIWRLGARIYDLKRQGCEIVCENVPTKDGRGRYGRYHLTRIATV